MAGQFHANYENEWGALMTVYLASILMVIGFSVSFDATASERKAYKIIDENGNVTYSQTPPTRAKSVQKIDISPANAGRGGNVVSRDIRNPQSNNYSEQHRQMMHSQQKKREEAEQKRVINLKAECARNRGSDCENPETLRLIESQKIPGGRHYAR